MSTVAREVSAVKHGGDIDILFREASSCYPSPVVLDSFEKYLPGAAKDILEMSKSAMEHAHSIENAASKRLTIGLIAGSILTALFLLVGAALIYTGHPVGGGSGIVIAFIILLNNLVTGSRQNPV